jgi:hypothetical protein
MNPLFRVCGLIVGLVFITFPGLIYMRDSELIKESSPLPFQLLFFVCVILILMVGTSIILMIACVTNSKPKFMFQVIDKTVNKKKEK